MLSVSWVQKGKGLPDARVISHFDLSLPGSFFHGRWIGPRLLSFQMVDYLIAHLNSNRSDNIAQCYSTKAPKFKSQ